MDNITITSVATRKILEKIIEKSLRKKGIGLNLIFTKPIEIKYDDNTKLVDVDLQIHVKVPLNDVDKLLGD